MSHHQSNSVDLSPRFGAYTCGPQRPVNCSRLHARIASDTKGRLNFKIVSVVAAASAVSIWSLMLLLLF